MPNASLRTRPDRRDRLLERIDVCCRTRFAFKPKPDCIVALVHEQLHAIEEREHTDLSFARVADWLNNKIDMRAVQSIGSREPKRLHAVVGFEGEQSSSIRMKLEPRAQHSGIGNPLTVHRVLRRFQLRLKQSRYGNRRHCRERHHKRNQALSHVNPAARCALKTAPDLRSS